MIIKVKRGFATHFMADLYMCQQKLWERPGELLNAIGEIGRVTDVTGFQWVFHNAAPDWLRITGEISDSFVWIQVFPEESFLAIDIFSWQPKPALKNFSESLIEVFQPQVVAVESKVRAEHLTDV
ncbi:MAG TPA: S-adenosylmethionine decarboxylase [Bacillota bacterium]|nr:S-adenosylmethionine decarboxylase [Bacillota bacterium]